MNLNTEGSRQMTRWKFSAGPLRLAGIVGALSVVLAGCVSEGEVPRRQIPPGASAAKAAEAFATDLAWSRAVGAFCGRYGIQQTYSNTRDVVGLFAYDLRAQGFSDQEVEAIGKRFTDTYNSYVNRYNYDLSDGTNGEFCLEAKRQIIAGKTRGGLVRLTN